MNWGDMTDIKFSSKEDQDTEKNLGNAASFMFKMYNTKKNA